MRSSLILLKALAVVLIFSLVALPATASAPEASDQSVRRGTMPPALDGSLTDWDGVPLMVLDLDTRAPSSSGGVERSDAFYTLQLLQTADALYLGLHARDEKLVADSGSELHKDDSLRFSVDGNKDGAGGAASDHAYRIRIDGKVNDAGGPEITTLTVITAAVTGGYNMEVKIPATALNLPLGSTSFKFNWAAGDDDNGGGLDTFYLYAGTGVDTPEPSWPTATLDGESFTPPGLLEAGRWEWYGGGSLGAVYAGSGGNVWAGGNGVWKTTNNGTNWNRWPLFANGEVQDIRFWDANRGLVLAGNKVYLTEDGGQTWRLSYDGANQPQVKLVTGSTDTGWLLTHVTEGSGARDTLMKTRDGGASWQRLVTAKERSLKDVAAFGADRAWYLYSELVSDPCFTTLFRTVDSGANWTYSCVADANGMILASNIAFVDSLTGWLVGTQGNQGVVYHQPWRTTDGGETWQKQNLAVAESPSWLAAIDTKTAWLAFGSELYRTTDGVNWSKVSSNAPDKAAFRTTSEGWGVKGRAIQRSSDGGATWTTVYTPSDAPLARWWDHLRGWRINGATVERTTDGGATWLAANTGLTAVDHLQMVSPQVGWAWHDASLGLRRTTDGGATWATQVTGSDALLDLQFVNATYGWVRDTAGNLRRTTNGGATWTLVTPPPLPTGPASLMAVRFANFNVGVAGMRQNETCQNWFSRTTDGGVTWSAPQPGPSADFTFGTTQIGWGVSACDPVFSSSSDNLFKTTSGASTWAELSLSNFFSAGLQAYDAEQLFAYSQGARVDKSSDGGTTFQPQRTETSYLSARSRLTTVFSEEPGSPVARMIYRNTEIPAYRTLNPLRIDGKLDDWGRAWQTSLKTSNAATAQGGIPTPLQSSGVLRALWDANNVYLAVQVYDDEIHVDTPDKPWQDDAVELAFDPAHDHLNQTPDDDRQYTITADGAQYLWGAPTVGLEVARQSTSDGYILEIRIPHDRMPSLKLNAGTVAGFNFSVLDDIDGGTAETRLFWTGNITSKPQANWGQIRFSAIDAETVTTPDTPTPTPTATGSPTPTETPTATPSPSPSPWPDNNVLSGRAWHDQDGDGVIDPDEPGLVNIAVRLYKNGAQIGQTATDGSGNYAFTSVIAGEYTVKAAQPTWLPFSSTPNEATVTVENGTVIVNFGDWEGLRGYLPMLLK